MSYCLCSTTMKMPIDVNWDMLSSGSPQNVTVLFYDKESGDLVQEHIYEHNNKDIQSYAYLEKGEYTAVVFNELRNQIDNVSCIDHENISTLMFCGTDDYVALIRSDVRSYIKQPGELAVSIIEGIYVTDQMIFESTYGIGVPDEYLDDDQNGAKSDSNFEVSDETTAMMSKMIDLSPVKKSVNIDIIVRVKNLYYARMPALVDLANISDGYYVHSDKNTTNTETIQFSMNNRLYDDGSYYDGQISASITSFGLLDDRSTTSSYSDQTPLRLDLLFMLVDKAMSTESYSVDITDQVKIVENSDGSISLYVDLELSEPLPVVEPDGSGDSGFGSDVDDWDSVDVPLII